MGSSGSRSMGPWWSMGTGPRKTGLIVKPEEEQQHPYHHHKQGRDGSLISSINAQPEHNSFRCRSVVQSSWLYRTMDPAAKMWMRFSGVACWSLSAGQGARPAYEYYLTLACSVCIASADC